MHAIQPRKMSRDTYLNKGLVFKLQLASLYVLKTWKTQNAFTSHNKTQITYFLIIKTSYSYSWVFVPLVKLAKY